LTPWVHQPNHMLASPGLHTHHQLELHQDSPQIHFPAELFDDFSWNLDFI
jgi:hypothetical protein